MFWHLNLLMSYDESKNKQLQYFILKVGKSRCYNVYLCIWNPTPDLNAYLSACAQFSKTKKCASQIGVVFIIEIYQALLWVFSSSRSYKEE